MNRVFAVGRAEYLQAVRSKAFLIALLLMPILMSGSIAFQAAVGDQVDLRDRGCAVVDPTGEIWPFLELAAAERNESGIWEQSEGEEGRKQVRPRFVLERHVPDDGERVDVQLSKRVEDGELQGFLLVSDTVLSDDDVGERALAYYTDEPTFTDLANWLGSSINEELRRRRFEEAGLDRELVASLQKGVNVSTWGLASERADGSIEEAELDNDLRTFGVPGVAMFLLFMLVMTSAPQLMNQVLEEKMQRISEVLISAVSPFQLMLGKLVGSVGVALTLAAVYLGGVFWATTHFGLAELIPTSAYIWFIVMMIFALLMYGSLFSALGSACSELRDAQSMMMPAMIVIMIPVFAWSPVLKSPNGTLAQVLTYFPTATPIIFLIRVLAPPGPPTWEIFAALAMCIATTLALVWASAKIFRIGVLSQGQTPSFVKLLRWIYEAV